MTTATARAAGGGLSSTPLRDGSRISLDHKVHPAAAIGFLAILLAGLAYAGTSIVLDTHRVGEPLAIGAFLFLGWPW